MKRMVVLMALLATAGVLWSQAAAPSYPQVTVGAVIQYMALPDFAAGREFSDQPKIEMKWTIKTDDFNTAYFELEEYPGDTLSTGLAGKGAPMNSNAVPVTGTAGTSSDYGAPVTMPFDRVWFTTDWGKALKLPVGVVTKFGFEEFNNIDFIKVTKSEWEDRLGEKDIRKWGMQIDVTPAPMVTLRSSWSWNPREKAFLAGAYGTVAPISYEVTYFTNGYHGAIPTSGDFNGIGTNESSIGDLKNWIEGGVKFQKDINKDLTVALAVEAEKDLADYDKDYTDKYKTLYEKLDFVTLAYQVGVRAIYQKIYSAGLSMRGTDAYPLGGLQAEVWAMPIKDKPLEFIAQAGFGLDSDLYDNMFDSLEAVLKYTIGKASFYVGVLYGPEGSRLIAKEWVDMNVGVYTNEATSGGPFSIDRALKNDVTALFFRGTLSF